MAETAADAAETASVVPTGVDVGARSDGAAGSSSTMTLSQNATRKRNRMVLSFIPDGYSCSRRTPVTLAKSLESNVRGAMRILCLFAANPSRIFRKFEMLQFYENRRNPPAMRRA